MHSVLRIMLRAALLPAALTLALATSPTLAQQPAIPDELQGWQQWVLDGYEYRACPFYVSRQPGEPDAHVCAWPGELTLDVTADGGRFRQSWRIHAEPTWVVLPGNGRYWPSGVRAGNAGVAVVERDGLPQVLLQPGTHDISGRFAWDERPGALAVPTATGLVALRVDGDVIGDVRRNGNEVLLGEPGATTRQRNTVGVDVHRLLVDDVPTRLVTRLLVNVAGGVREELLGTALPAGFTPMRLESALPARLEADGQLRVQVRPGSWVVTIEARAAETRDMAAAPEANGHMPGDEIWSYQDNAAQRITSASGAQPVDPRQVGVPNEWQHLPAFRLQAGARLDIEERSRGLVDKGNDLTLVRSLWLDFDGDGFVTRDTIGGAMRSGWRLDMLAPYALQSATESGDNLLVTSSGDGRTGIEVRGSSLAVTALASGSRNGALPATGWDNRFDDVNAALYLPPGHKLVGAPGVDTARGSWVGKWALLDLFLLLIVSTAVWKLFGRGAGLVAFAGLALGFHEGVPVWIWLVVLAGVALVRVAPAGRLRTASQVIQWGGAALLLLALVPFLAMQLRIAIYPQLEPQPYYPGSADFPRIESEPAASPVRLDKPEEAQILSDDAAEADESRSRRQVRPSQTYSRYESSAPLQAGQGVPSWQWNRYHLNWDGPVDPGQTMRLIILPRWAVTLLRFVEVVLLLGLVAVIAAEMLQRQWRLPGGINIGRTAAVLLLAGFALPVMMPQPAGAETPDPVLLEELRERLLEPPDCVPGCAEVVRADVSVGTGDVAIVLQLRVLDDVAIPLPGSQRGWHADAVRIDGSPGRVFRAPDNNLWVEAGPGERRIELRGAIPDGDTLQIPFAASPGRIAVDADGWLVTGIRDGRLQSGVLQLTRLETGSDSGAVRWESSRFPAFVRVERNVVIDLDWTVTTRVVREAPTTGAITLQLPLLDGESVLTDGLTVDDGSVLIAMGPGQRQAVFRSELPRRSPLVLRAGDGSDRHEIWAFAVGSSWHAGFDGVPESRPKQDSTTHRNALFYPRAGETLTMEASRPQPVDGATLAFDAVRLQLAQGQRSATTHLQLQYRSTRGSQYALTLPPGSDVIDVTIDGQSQPIRANDGVVTLPILPGEHALGVNWQSPDAAGWRIATPALELGAPASNVDLVVDLPHNRWLLATSGPALGPAVLYWSELVVLIIAAVVLGRTRLAPLGTRHWLLLGLGFSTFNWPILALVVIWLLGCALLARFATTLNWWQFNLRQVIMAGATVVALLAIVIALPFGLLGTPDMHVTGHGSYGNHLAWFADRTASTLPVAGAYSLPLWVYKVLILGWALWLSVALLRWLRWVWRCLAGDGLWRRRGEAVAPAGGNAAAENAE